MTLDIFVFGTVLGAFAGVSLYLIAPHGMRRHFTTTLRRRRAARSPRSVIRPNP